MPTRLNATYFKISMTYTRCLKKLTHKKIVLTELSFWIFLFPIWDKIRQTQTIVWVL